MKRALSLFAAALVCLCTPLHAAAAFDAIYAFGDSLTDTGNEPAEPLAHYDGRWSNGPLWVEYLSQRFGFVYSQTNNRAESGAQCNDTYGQVTDYFPVGDVSNSLFVVWAGGNDFLQNYDKYWFNDSAWSAQINYSISQLSNAVAALVPKGARFILVPNTADITQIPTINSLPDFARDYLRDQVKLFNSRLATAINRLQATNSSSRIVGCDVYTSTTHILHNASLYGFTETEIDALADITLLDKSFDGPGANYVFWDPIHPTTKTHALIADWFHAAVAPMSPQLAFTTNKLQITCGSMHVTKLYALLRTTNFTSWSTSQTFRCVAANQIVTVTNNFPREFFRLTFTP